MKSLAITATIAVLATGAFAQSSMNQSRYGGPVYNGAPALAVTASFINAGGGAKHFSTPKALTSMLGAKLVSAEVAKLTKQYGKAKVSSWLQVFDFAVNDSIKKAVAAGVKLPKGTMHGKELAVTLVKAGLDTDGTFYTEFMLDKAVSHNIHMAVMDDIDKKFGLRADADYHRITNQAMVDAAHALGANAVKLAAFH